jgi:syntaxin 1B/2/3
MSYSNPYANAPGAEAGYGHGREQHEMQNYAQPYAQESNPYAQETTPYSQGGNPYAQDDTDNYQQPQAHDAPGGANQGYGGGEHGNDFFSKLTHARGQIGELDNEIFYIDQKQKEALSSTNPARDQQEVEQMIQTFKMKCSDIRAQLQALKNEAGSDRSKAQHVNTSMGDFKRKYQRLLEQERKYQQDVRTAMERQYLIVNQDATPEEARRAVEETDFNSQGGLFQQAVRPHPQPTRLRSET